jgi:alpha-beta hydrolase superfamily lysophospholipase
MFSGFPNSRLDGELVHKFAIEIGLHVYTIDRPGIGQSDFHPKREILDWLNDVSDFLDFVGSDRIRMWELPQKPLILKLVHLKFLIE